MSQPYRATSRRRQTAALSRMQRGKGPLHHLASARRTAMKRKKKGRRGNRNYSGPVAKILRKRKRVGGY
jgi:hypothetical protein